jgi:hypothetical protein
MKNLRQLIKENLLLEKRIGQISSQIEIIFSYDVIKTTHSTERETRYELEDYNKKPISNGELVEFINLFKRDISEHIVSGEIEDQVPFVIKSDDWELACVIVPDKQSMVYWKLIIKTVFRENPSNRLRVGKDQLVLVK